MMFGLSHLKLHRYPEALRPITGGQTPAHSSVHATVSRGVLNEVCQDGESMLSFQGQFPENKIQIA